MREGETGRGDRQHTNSEGLGLCGGATCRIERPSPAPWTQSGLNWEVGSMFAFVDGFRDNLGSEDGMMTGKRSRVLRRKWGSL